MIRVYKILILLALGTFALLSGNGRAISGASLLAMLAYIGVSGRQMTQIRLDHVWALSYALLISAEGFFDVSFITKTVDVYYFNRAVEYLTLINVGFLLAFNTIRPVDITKAFPAQYLIKRGYLWFLALGMVAFLVSYAPIAFGTIFQGRAVLLDEDSSVRGLTDLVKGGVIRNLGTFLPIAFAYQFYFFKDIPKYRAMLYTGLAYAPILLIQLAMGVRSPLVLTALGLLAIHSSRYPGGPDRLLKLAGLGAAFLTVSTALKQLRTYGLSQSVTVNFDYGQGQRFPTSEGVVEYFTRLVQYFDFVPLRGGQEHLAVALFWVPRSLWPAKPEQLEHWFFRDYWGPGSVAVSDAHSIAASFAATSYADFGFLPTLVIWTLAGFLFAVLNRYVMTYLYIQTGHRRAVWAAILVGLTFYALRQINLVIFLAVGFTVIWVIYNYFVYNWFTEKQVQEAAQQRLSPSRRRSGLPLPSAED